MNDLIQFRSVSFEVLRQLNSSFKDFDELFRLNLVSSVSILFKEIVRDVVEVLLNEELPLVIGSALFSNSSVLGNVFNKTLLTSFLDSRYLS